MKASIKLSENSKPTMRAKVPMTVLGFPFRSGMEVAGSDDLSLSLSSFFQSGPLVKLLYRPYDSLKPFSIVLKTGLGLFGSPLSAPLTISAELNVLGDAAPSFLLNFRPRIGDFSLRRSVLSDPDLFAEDDRSVPKFIGRRHNSLGEKLASLDEGEVPVEEEKRGFSGKRTAEKVFAGMEVSARTLLPVRDHALLKFRWRLKLPSGGEEEIGRGLMAMAVPCLTLSKIGIEHVATNRGLMKPDEVAEACLAVKKELQVLQEERGNLRNAVDELRAAICPVKLQLHPHNSDSGGARSLFSAKKSKGDNKKPTNDNNNNSVTTASAKK